LTEAIKILIVDDDEMYRHTYSLILTEQGYDVTTASNGGRGLELFKKGSFSIVLVDYRMPDMDGIEFLKQAQALDPQADIVLITAFASIETAVEAIKMGAFHYIDKPAPADKLIALVQKIVEKQRRFSPAASSSLDLTFDGAPLNIIGKSPRMQEVFQIILKTAPTDSTVLLLGESGTGKELFAKAIHAAGLRREKPFFTMDCSTLVETLFESELFGHVKGSFTGATATKHGAFELAHMGTFFFDEIGNIPLSVQAKILRAIQEKEIRRVGGTQTIHVDVRVIAATNLDLQKAVNDGRFREDLYYRLNVIPIHLPSLRERREDIPLLVDHFIRLVNRKRRKPTVGGISREALDLLAEYHWPGNIRELQNVIERALVIEEKSTIQPSSLPQHIRDKNLKKISERESLADVEKAHIKKVLESQQHNISQAARTLGIDRKTLYDKIRKYGLKGADES
jgi:two-component system, NtrC family, response regulator HydG